MVLHLISLKGWFPLCSKTKLALQGYQGICQPLPTRSFSHRRLELKPVAKRQFDDDKILLRNNSTWKICFTLTLEDRRMTSWGCWYGYRATSLDCHCLKLRWRHKTPRPRPWVRSFILVNSFAICAVVGSWSSYTSCLPRWGYRSSGWSLLLIIFE